MRLTFEHGWPLLLLLAVVPIWWARRTTIIEFHRRQLDMMAAARALAVVLLALALAEPTLYRNGSWTAVAYLLDVSRSVDPATVEEAIDWLERAVALAITADDIDSSEHEPAFFELRPKRCANLPLALR